MLLRVESVEIVEIVDDGSGDELVTEECGRIRDCDNSDSV